ncbi:hypothetical protein [Salinirussus salinus]|uniref:hypothetical protein n=1 Tax=Salinirussus salinus TaxID=1198300 RepID=UPI001357C6DD|nr:hypothetical protein [Salinirussus salinus]
MPTSCSIYELDSPIDTNDLLDRVNDDYQHTGSHPEIEDSLLTDVVDVHSTNRGVACTIRYDTPKQRGSREDESPWYIDVERARVRYTDQYFILLGNHSGRALRNAQEIINVSPDEVSKVTITTSTVARVYSQDGQGGMRGSWNNADEYIDNATLSGEIEQSGLTTEIRTNPSSQPTFRQFASQSYDENTVGLSSNQDRVAFWGSDWNESDYEDYIYQFILPNSP